MFDKASVTSYMWRVGRKRMFNQIRYHEGEMLRVWSKAEKGHYLINPKGIMRWYPENEIAKMPLAILPVGAEVPGAFPAQDPRPEELM